MRGSNRFCIWNESDNFRGWVRLQCVAQACIVLNGAILLLFFRNISANLKVYIRRKSNKYVKRDCLNIIL